MALNFSKSILQEIKQSIQLASPVIISNWLYAINQFAATWMASQLGQKALAAMAIAFALYVLAMVIVNGISSGISVIVSQDLGAKKTQGIRDAFVQGTWLTLLCALLSTIIMWYSPKLISKITPLDPTVFKLMTSYLHALTWVIFPCALLTMIEKFLIGLQRSKTVFYLGLLAVPLAILFNYIFTFGIFTFPAFGIAGLGYGTATAYMVDALIFYCLVAFSPSLRSYHLFSAFRHFPLEYLYEIWRIGWPLALMYTIEFGSFLILTFMMANIGTYTLAAYQMVRPFLNFAVVTAFAVAETAAVRVGFAVGEKNRPAIYRAFYVNLVFGLLLVGSICLIYLFFHKTFINFDLNGIRIHRAILFRHAIHFLMAVIILVCIDTLRLTTAGALRGLKDTKVIMASSIIGYAMLGLLSSYVLGNIFNMGGLGLWFGFILGGIISMTIVWWRFKKLAQTIDLLTAVEVEKNT